MKLPKVAFFAWNSVCRLAFIRRLGILRRYSKRQRIKDINYRDGNSWRQGYTKQLIDANGRPYDYIPNMYTIFLRYQRYCKVNIKGGCGCEGLAM